MISNNKISNNQMYNSNKMIKKSKEIALLKNQPKPMTEARSIVIFSNVLWITMVFWTRWQGAKKTKNYRRVSKRIHQLTRMYRPNLNHPLSLTIWRIKIDWEVIKIIKWATSLLRSCSRQKTISRRDLVLNLRSLRIHSGTTIIKIREWRRIKG